MAEEIKIHVSELPDILTLKDVSDYLGVGRKTALGFVKQNFIKHLKIGREYKIIKKSLIEFMGS